MGTDTAISIDVGGQKDIGTTCLSFQQISYQVRGTNGKTKQLLHDISGSFRSGRLAGIMGPSGAGKSTLLNVLSGFKGKTSKMSGKLLVNGQPIKPQSIAAVTYVPDVNMQEHHRPGSLDFATELKLQNEVSLMAKSKIPNDIVKLLGLQSVPTIWLGRSPAGKAASLSGLESISNPKIFKAWGFDHPNYYNRADFALEVASLKHEGNVLTLIEKACETPEKEPQQITMVNNSPSSDEKDAMLLPSESSSDSSYQPASQIRVDHSRQYPVSQWNQFVTLTKRTTLCTFRDMQLMKMRIMTHLFVGLLIGVVFWDVGNDGAKVLSNASCLFFFLIFVFFSNSMPLVMTFPLETAVFLREQKNNWYSLKAYFFSKLVSDFPFLLLGPTLFLASAYYMTSQPLELDRMVMLWGMCMLTAWIAQLTGLLAGSSLPLELSVFCVPCSLIPMLMFCGFFVRFREMFDFLVPFTYLGYFRYSFEGAMQAIYGFGRENLPCAESFCYFGKVSKFLESFDMVENTFVMDVAGLGVWIVAMHVVLFGSLAWKIRRNQ
ncbi:hypothetical protein pipiens_001405 [Culex pipiens pipiens]|uniref:ABC transporter domain-containing protein n=1 Tax=Culex pipiens pipiens TaxID=38569 RepID=A0ABD1CX53_CULPP